MKKSSSFLALMVMLTFVFVSCESNEPGTSEQTSLPATAREVLRVKAADAKQILKDRGFYAPSWDTNIDNLVLIYPKELASEDATAQAKAQQGSWMEVNCYTEGANIINTVWGEQHVPTAADATKVFNQWTSYLEKTITNYDLHVVWINKSGDSFVYEEGKLFEEYKTKRLQKYEEGYAKGQITKDQLDEERKRLSVTKADLSKYLTYLSIDEEFSRYEIYIEITNASNNVGVQTMSTFDNYPADNDTKRRMLEHRLQYTNVESMVETLLSMSDQ